MHILKLSKVFPSHPHAHGQASVFHILARISHSPSFHPAFPSDLQSAYSSSFHGQSTPNNGRQKQCENGRMRQGGAEERESGKRVDKRSRGSNDGAEASVRPILVPYITLPILPTYLTYLS